MSYVAVVMQPASSHIRKVISATTGRPGSSKSSTCGRNSAGHPRCPPRAVGDTSVLPTKKCLYGLRPGDEHPSTSSRARLLVGFEAVSDPDERGMRTLNGQLRPVSVRDRSVDAQVKAAEKADRADPGRIAAPFAGVVTLPVSEGDTVDAGQQVAPIEAMKMEAAITAPAAGTVSRVAISEVQPGRGR
jgi:pyruvate carboxylase